MRETIKRQLRLNRWNRMQVIELLSSFITRRGLNDELDIHLQRQLKLDQEARDKKEQLRREASRERMKLLRKKKQDERREQEGGGGGEGSMGQGR